MRYNSIIDGCSIADISLALNGYNYYLYTRPDNQAVIMQESVAETQYRYTFFPNKIDSSIDVFWTNKETQKYVRTSSLKAL